MAFDAVAVRCLVKDLKDKLINSRIDKIHQPEKDEITINLRTMTDNFKLVLSASPAHPRVHFTNVSKKNPISAPMFCMLLRKRIGGGKLVAVRQQECDRVLFLDFECVNELGDTVLITVVCEIMGMYSNIIIVDSNGVIIDSLKRVDLTMSSRRLVLPNIKYELPESQNKLNLLECTAIDVCTAVKNLDAEMPLNKALLRTIEGVSPIVCREIEYKVMEGATNRIEGVLFDRLAVEIERLKSVCSDCSGKPVVVYREDGKPMDFCFMNVEQYGDFAKVESKESFSDLLDGFYEARDSRDRMRVKSQSLTKLLNNTLERLARKIAKQQSELERCADREHLRICGDLLQANIYRIERGAEYVDVENFYDENNAILRIKLNPAISPSANAQKYYKDYRKAKNAEIMLKEQLEKGREELDYIDSVLDTVDRAENEKDLAQIREELTEQGYLKVQKGKKPRQTTLPPLEFESSDGFKILVGRNNRQNDKLTLKTASKNDMWLHTKDIHGSHVIVVSDGKKISDTAICEAAQLAAYHSKARNSSQVPVDYTLVRYVSKPNGSKPGMVIYVNNKTLYVKPSQFKIKTE